ncbi:MAG: MFS transporter [Candidatus Lokiarchaeota archaeon]|nr:MFS transporter [Candidatus Lokiarchaeota archaeon]MBD3339138.1 MFS transporter [Candidatus Lokiarchaeota archaeon]
MENDKVKVTHSKANLASYGFGSMSREFVQMAFNVLVFFYYETEVGLNVWLIGFGLVIFAVWNAINDPLIGYLTNRPFKFTRKWGRRLPWILLGGIPLGFAYFLLFTPPAVDPESGAWILFGWLVFTTCLFDTLHSLFFVNFQSVFPDKFRSVDERRTATGIQIILGVIGVTLGAMLPPLFITYGQIETYIFQGILVFVITLVTLLLSIPGVKEDPETIEVYLSSSEREEKRTPFLESMKYAFKQKSFVAYIFLYTMYWVIINSVEASIPYLVRFSLKLPASATTFVMGGFLLGAVVSIPIWVKMAKKTNDNGKIMLICAVLMGLTMIPLFFIGSYLGAILGAFLFGLAQGGYWAMIFPVFSDVIDESVVLHKKREEGTYIGIQQFFGRLGLIIQVMSFAIIHELTGFEEGADTQTPLAILGIHIHLAIVPMICVLLGALVFWRLYDLKPENVDKHQEVIKTLKI